ncbi:MAG: histidine ammonia-lyase [Candidatus Bathyarchaeota archaeon]|nr:histidine ammonia-lyase [Candidatus Bathyarchaeota archaeon]MDH5787159.1 histidine ammonia-lyase [Candidatus Bathyarchaeota archaeon]
MHEVHIDGETLTIEDIVKVARENWTVTIPEKAKNRVKKSRKVLERLVEENNVIYGVNTGFGALSNVVIPPEEINQLQSNLIRSHSTGVGKPLNTEIVRASMLLRANTLAKGYSGIRLETLETLVEMLNKKVHPIIPAKGSVGASGDLAPLSHMILVLIGEGKAEYQGRIMSGKEAMEKAGIKPVKLKSKEGVALNNGTQVMTAIAALTIHDAENLIKTAEVATALTLETLLGVTDAFDERIHKVRAHGGQAITAKNIKEMIAGSTLVQTGKKAMKTTRRPHDPYSLRCAPQVLGAARDAIAYCRRVVEVEINSATDNPLVFPDEEICLSGGNFHGQPISIAMDMLGIALTMIGNISERRTARLLDEKLNNGLPAFLIPPQAKTGLNSGLMTIQYTAVALTSENKILAHPACVDSIPTSANFEDFVSMGTTAAQKALQILENTEYIIAIELLCAAQAAEFRRPGKLGKGTEIAYSTIRKFAQPAKEDKALSENIEKVRQTIRNHVILNEIKNKMKSFLFR